MYRLIHELLKPLNMEYALTELKRIATNQRGLMESIREETPVMDLDSIRRIKGYTELILELEARRQTLITVISKSSINS